MSKGEAGIQAPPVPTPCLGICKLDEPSGLCLGCARNAEEISVWQLADPGYKRAVWGLLPPRRAHLGLSAYRLPWSAADIAAMIERTLRQRSGCWALGIEGATARFAIGSEEQARIVGDAEAVTAITARGALRLAKHAKTIAFAYGAAADARGPEAIALVLPRGRLALRRGNTIYSAGPDVAAISGTFRRAELFDLGVASNLAARYGLRSNDAGLSRAMRAMQGLPWSQALLAAASTAANAPPHIVVETGLGRVEIFSQGPADDATAPRAELDAARLVSGREMPSGWMLNGVFAPCALFYPNQRVPVEALLNGRG